MRRWFLFLFRRQTVEKQLDAELRFHLDQQVRDYVSAGMTPAEARRKARLEFGGLDQIKDECRDVRPVRWLEDVLQDLRYGLRVLATNWGFTIVAVLTLALGIGINTAIFSLVNGVLLRPLPYKDAGQLVFVAATDAERGANRNVMSYPDFADCRAQDHLLAGLAAYRSPQSYDLTGGDRPARIPGLRASQDFFTVFDEQPALGRAFLPEEYQAGKEHEVIVSDALWHTLFGGDPGLIGKTLKLNDDVYTVVGIMPPGFDFPANEHPGFYLPLAPEANRNHGWLWAVGRLKAGVRLQEAQAEINTIASRLARQYPRSNKGRGLTAMPLREALVGDMRPAVLVFAAAVALVMLICCANVANMMLARAMAREREFAVRAAIGAGRSRLVRQLLVESTMLSLIGGAFGLLLAGWGGKLLVALLERSLTVPRLENVRIDGWVLGFTILISLATGVIFGLAPAMAGSRLNLSDPLKAANRAFSGGLRARRLRSLLVVSELALALMLLAGAGLMMKSFLMLSSVNTGVNIRNVLTADFSLRALRYSNPAVRMEFFREVIERVRTIPGVSSASWVTALPLTKSEDSLGFSIAGRPAPTPDEQYHHEARFNIVGPDYFRTLGIPLRKGRDFGEQDSVQAPGVAVINEAMMRRFWPNEDPLGRQISTDGSRWFSIVGVVGDVRQMGPDSESSPEIYWSYLQDPQFWVWRTLVVRTLVDPMRLVGSVQQAVWSVNKDQPISSIQTMEEVQSDAVSQPRVITLLLVVFAAVALVLAAIGIYGVVAYSVTQRTHEIGIRMAAGACHGDVLRLIIGEGMLLTAAGLGIGLAGAFALTRFLSRFLYVVRPTDPLTFSLVALTLIAVALLASYLPARRATQVDPVVALRCD